MRRIRSRLIWSFSLLSLLIIVVFSLFNFLFVYAVEDVFFDRLVAEEKAYVISRFKETGQLPAPRQTFMQILNSPEQLPPDLREKYTQDPDRPEYAGGDGRHYHVSYNDEPSFILLAEVSEYLVVRSFRSVIFSFLFVGAVVMLIVAVIIALLLGNRLARPIESLAALFQDARANELPTGFAAAYPDNEVGVLAQGMEQAMERISAFLAREQEFTRDVSHELRTPVAIMKGALEVVEQGDNSINADVLRRMRSAVVLMEQNIETLLAMAREESADAAERTALLPVVERVVIDHAGLLEGRAIDVHVDVEPGIAVLAPRGMVHILLNNLVSNAFQHTQEGRVSIQSADGSTLVVSDTGPGIDPAIEEDVFTGFVKGANSAGFGVGLSIVKRLCEQQGWELQLSSSASGTRVAVFFPP